jgi:hypothetical protein
MAQTYPQVGTSGSYIGDLPINSMAMRSQTTQATMGPAGPTGGLAGTNKLWLPLWSGEVINAYDQYNMFENMINTKTISGGFAYEFPMTGTIDLEPAWNAGQELFGTGGKSATIKVALDNRPMAAHFETDNIDLLVTQWDYRSELARQAGLTLANTRDKQIAMTLAAACALPQLASSADPRGLAATAFQDPGLISGQKVSSSCTEAEALIVLQEIENYLVTCQENDIAVTDVYCVVRPKVFQVIRALGIPRASISSGAASIASVSALNYNGPMFGGSDDYGNNGQPINTGFNVMTDALDYMGVKIIKSNHLPGSGADVATTSKDDYSVAANNIGGKKYNLNTATKAFSSTTAAGLETNFSLYGIIFQPAAIAGLSLQGMKVDTVQDVRRNTQFTVASMLKGTGVVRPELCKALISGSGSTVTRAKLLEHFDKSYVSGGTAAGNLTSGFGAEYANISSSSY